MSMILGIDCGMVIFDPLGRQIPGAMKSIGKIARSGRFQEIYIVSRANIFNRAYFAFRLSLLHFWRATGIPKDHLYFCSRNKNKSVISKSLNITHFVDDRIDVLRHMESTTRLFALNPKKSEIKRFPETAKAITIVRSWEELLPLLS